MSTLVVDTLTGKSTATTLTIGSTPVVSASANSLTIRGEGSAQTSVQQGLLKAWANMQGSSTANIKDSFNVSGLTDNGTGNFTVSVANDLANANGVMSGYSIMDGLVYGENGEVSAAGSFRMRVVVGNTNASMDPDDLHVMIAGDLA